MAGDAYATAEELTFLRREFFGREDAPFHERSQFPISSATDISASRCGA